MITDLDPDENKIFNSTVVIFGGCSYIGSHVSQLFMRHGAKKVMVIDNLSNIYKRKRFEVLKSKKAECYELNLDSETDFSLIEELIMQESDINYVLYFSHQVGPHASVVDPQSICKEIERFTKTLNLVATLPTVNKFVYESSADVYGENYEESVHFSEDRRLCPQTPYASMIASCEHIASSITGTVGLPTLGLRFFTVYGPDQRITAEVDEPEYDLCQTAVWIKNAFFNESLVLDCTYKDTWSMCHINDCAELVIRACIGSDEVLVLNIGDTYCVSKLETAELISTLVSSYLKRTAPCNIDVKEISFMQSLITGEDETDDSDIVSYQQPDLSLMSKYTRYTPQVNLMKGMQETISTCGNIYIGQLKVLEEQSKK